MKYRLDLSIEDYNALRDAVSWYVQDMHKCVERAQKNGFNDTLPMWRRGLAEGLQFD